MLPSSSTNANPAMLTASHAMLTRSGGPRSTLPKGTFLGVWVPKVKETQVKGQVYGPYRKQTPRMTAATTPPAAVLFPPRFVLQTDEDTDSDEDMAELLAEVKEEIEVKVEDVPIMPLNRITRFQMISENNTVPLPFALTCSVASCIWTGRLPLSPSKSSIMESGKAMSTWWK